MYEGGAGIRPAVGRWLLLLFAFAWTISEIFGGTSLAYANGDIVHVSTGNSSSVRVARGKPKAIQVSEKFHEIVIGDPEIATITPLTDRSFYVLGQELGTTGIAIFDSNMNLTRSINVEVTLDIAQLSAAIRETVPGSNITVRSANGRIVLSGWAPDAVAAEKARRIAEQFAGDEEIINSIEITTPQQVQLNVRFVEIDREVGKELGTSIRAAYRTPSGGIEINTSPQATSNTPAGQLVGELLSGGFSIDVVIDALEDRGIARRLAEPNLIARSGESASFLAGGEFPIPVSEEEGSVTVSYKRFGVGLDFRPTVLSGGLIALEIAPEVSSIDTTSSYRVGNIAIPGFAVRQAKTAVTLKSGQSFMIAGLLQTQNDVITQRVPGVGQLPVLGALFSSKAYQRRETDLVIIITPHLVKPIDPSMEPVTPTDQTAAPRDAEFFLGNVEEVRVPGNNRAGTRTAATMPTSGHFLELQ